MKEAPKTFAGVQVGADYHKRNKIVGWFRDYATFDVYWTYGDGSFSLSGCNVSDAELASRVNIKSD